MNYNYICFCLKKLQLGPIDAACQELQYALKNSARANVFPFFLIFPYVSVVFIVDPTAKFLKLYVQAANSMHFISDEVRNQKFDACSLVQIVAIDQSRHLLPYLGSVPGN